MLAIRPAFHYAKTRNRKKTSSCSTFSNNAFIPFHLLLEHFPVRKVQVPSKLPQRRIVSIPQSRHLSVELRHLVGLVPVDLLQRVSQPRAFRGQFGDGIVLVRARRTFLQRLEIQLGFRLLLGNLRDPVSRRPELNPFCVRIVFCLGGGRRVFFVFV